MGAMTHMPPAVTDPDDAALLDRIALRLHKGQSLEFVHMDVATIYAAGYNAGARKFFAEIAMEQPEATLTAIEDDAAKLYDAIVEDVHEHGYTFRPGLGYLADDPDCSGCCLEATAAFRGSPPTGAERILAAPIEDAPTMSPQSACAIWNAQWPAGTEVRYWVPGDPQPRRGRTLSDAYVVLGAAFVVVSGNTTLPLSYVTAQIEAPSASDTVSTLLTPDAPGLPDEPITDEDWVAAALAEKTAEAAGDGGAA